MYPTSEPTAVLEAGGRSQPPGVSLRTAAIVAGLGLLVMSVLAFASFSAFDSLVVEGDAATTARNMVDHELRFRLIICGYVLVAALDVVVAWALYVLLRPVDRSIALLAAWLRVAYAAVFAAATSNLLVAVGLLTGPDPRSAQAMVSLRQFQDQWDVGLAIFGLHLLVLGYLLVRSSDVPSLLGILVTIASLGYLVDSFGGFLSGSYDANVAMFTFAGEVLLMVWLLWRGGRSVRRVPDQQGDRRVARG
jgi:hypothetical protein